jgi:ParB family chromosome partitioning protein
VETLNVEKAKNQITEVNMASIRDNSLLSISVMDRDIDRCAKTIRQYGLLTPLVVKRCEDGNHLVLSGECELMALREMGAAVTEAVIVDLKDSAEANKVSLLLSSLRQSPNALSEGLILRELLKAGSQTQADLAYLVGKSVSWVSKRLTLVDRLKESVVALVASKNLSPHTAQEIARLPKEVQHDFAAKVVLDSLPKSSVEKLVSAYNTPGISDSVKKSIIENPRDTVSHLTGFHAKKQLKKESSGMEATQKLKSNLIFLLRIIGESEGLLADLENGQFFKLLPLLKKAGESAARFARLAAEYLNKNGS